MSSWQVRGQERGVGPLPSGLRIAGMGARLSAWLIDLVILGFLSLIPVCLAVVSGAVGLNPEAAKQMESNPNLQLTVPLLVVNIAPLIAWAAVWVVFAVGYAAACWTFLRGLPGQKLVSLQVADAATGENLSFARAMWRSVALNGIPAVAAALVLVVSCEVLTTIAPADYGAYDTNRLYSTWGSGLSSALGLASLASWVWPVILLITTASRADKRGLHDRLAGSVVVGRAPMPTAWSYPYGPIPGAPYGFGGSPGAVYPPGPGYPPVPGFVPGIAYPPAVSQQAMPPAPSVSSGEAQALDGATGNMPADHTPPVARPGLVAPGAEESPWGSHVPAAPPSEPRARAFGAGGPPVLGATLPEGLRVARFNRRAAAYAIDCVIVLILFGAIETTVVGPQNPNSPLPPERLTMIAGLASGLVQALYFISTWCLWRGAFGQKALSLQVGNATTGHRLGPIDALVRWAVLQGPFALYLAAPALLSLAVGIAAFAWLWLVTSSVRRDPDGRGFHDRIANSMVVEEA